MRAQIFHIFFFFLTASSKNDPFKSHEQIFRTYFNATPSFAEVGRATCHSAVHLANNSCIAQSYGNP